MESHRNRYASTVPVLRTAEMTKSLHLRISELANQSAIPVTYQREGEKDREPTKEHNITQQQTGSKSLDL